MAPADLLSTIGICIAAAALLALGGWQLRQPLILAYLITGVAIGPVGLNFVHDPASISTVSEIGLILLLFIIGLEIDLKKLMAAGAPHYPLSELLGVKAVPAQIDGALFVLIGIAISTQPLLYGMTRQLVDAQNAGKALSAINLAFFLGAALMQSSTGVVAAIFGLPAVLLFMAATLIVGTIVFLIYT